MHVTLTVLLFIYTILSTIFFSIVNQRKAVAIIFIALLVLIPPISIYFALYHHHRSSSIKTRVSNFTISHFDIRDNHLSYNFNFFPHIFNYYKTYQVHIIKSKFCLLFAHKTISVTYIPPFSLFSSESKQFTIHLSNKIYFNPKKYVFDKNIFLYLLITFDIKTQSTLDPRQTSGYQLQTECNISAAKVRNRYILLHQRCKDPVKL